MTAKMIGIITNWVSPMTVTFSTQSSQVNMSNKLYVNQRQKSYQSNSTLKKISQYLMMNLSECALLKNE